MKLIDRLFKIGEHFTFEPVVRQSVFRNGLKPQPHGDVLPDGEFQVPANDLKRHRVPFEVAACDLNSDVVRVF